MKAIVLAAMLTFGATQGRAQWAVVDLANLQQNAANYAAMVDQLSNQATQIANQVQQIQQYENQLKRLGSMADVKAIVGFPEFRADLSLPTKITTWAEGLTKVDGRGLFGDTRGGVFRGITPDYPDFDGRVVDRDETSYKQSHDMVVAVDEFKAVQSDVYTRREDLKRAIAGTSEALQSAETDAEEKKLEAVLNAQYAQLSSVDAEVALSAAQVQVKAAETTAMDDAESEADAEARKRLAQQEATKLAATFKPRYESLLQYVTEKRFTP